jgi:HK97 family phage prohead protease
MSVETIKKQKRTSAVCIEHNCDLCLYNERDVCDKSTSFKPKDAQAEKKSTADNDIELRTFDITELRVDQTADKKPVIKGCAIVFNKLSEDLGGFREQVDPRSCAGTIKTDDIRAAFNHDPNFILGRNKAGTLQLEQDDKGIHFAIDPPDTQWCRDLQVSIGRGDINQCSFKFNTIKDSWENKKDGSAIRTLMEIKLFDISIVTYPAYPQTSVKVRDYLNALSQSEEELDGKDALAKGSAYRLASRKRKTDIAQRS